MCLLEILAIRKSELLIELTGGIILTGRNSAE
jgi:hypothetical protein